ncbi:iron-containing alcohol dehydrogenase family protein [Paenibacillus sp. 19GGS1-52]|uniref:iron-containing alcohol dehydrogenase family protein n=1 Tax=Paenibacillus sp. 19GGS1-52 TaxID=2758563 RepID=UPI001EFBD0ED|nr:iron-containing alcohol dehydrogenase family protein [Paenibacillus sp. 19GGS1-52]ULO06426.1 iron-containing alcohol dehydrogenase family protein [Paenibacillus sp. 19GGS1-52]
MLQDIIVRAAPQEFICRAGSWNDLEQHLEKRGIGRVLIVHGTRSWTAAAPYLPELKRTEVHLHVYSGECTYEERDRIAAYLAKHELQAVIGVGGGKITDLVKSAAALLHLPAIILPTLASTCAAWSSLSVMYDTDGAFIRFEVFPRSNALVLLDPQVIANSPPEFLVAGIGDTLAKWYEADVIIRQLDKPPVEVELAWFAAQKCRDNLLAYSEQELDALRTGELNDALIRIVETNIMVAGLVGGFGENYGRTAGAHSIHDALTSRPEAHNLLHGNKVAYGVLVQLALEENWSEIDFLLPFYTQLGLPASLEDMGLNFLTREDLLKLGERATEKGASIHMMSGEIHANIVADSIQQLEDYIAGQRKDARNQGVEAS